MKVVEKTETHILCPITFFFLFRKSCHLWDILEKLLQCVAGLRWQYVASALHAWYLGLQIHVQVVYYILIFHCNNGCTNAPHCCILLTLPFSCNVFGVILNTLECRKNFRRHCTQSLVREFYVELAVSMWCSKPRFREENVALSSHLWALYRLLLAQAIRGDLRLSW